MSYQAQTDSLEREIASCVTQNFKLYTKRVGTLQLGFQRVVL